MIRGDPCRTQIPNDTCRASTPPVSVPGDGVEQRARALDHWHAWAIIRAGKFQSLYAPDFEMSLPVVEVRTTQ